MIHYEEVINKIENSRRFGKAPGVEVSSVVLEGLKRDGRIRGNIPFIHVAGTNGKGSTCAFLSNILKKMGYKVGTFTSPHLIDFEERIVINNKKISREKVSQLGQELLSCDFGVELTMFDYCLIMAIMYFEEEKCDYMILETGLGGRLDSTNAIGTPILTVITKIGFDHMAILGDDLVSIASEKAGVIKPGTSLVVEKQNPQVMEVFRKKAKEEGVELNEVLKEDINQIKNLSISLLGVHQWENAAAAKKGINLLNLERYDEKTVDEAIRQTHWKGRMEKLSDKPFLLVDGAHNSNGVWALKTSLVELYPDEKFVFFMGVMADKDYPLMIKEMLPIAKEFVTVTPESGRALQAKELAEYISKEGVKATSISDVEEMLLRLDSDYKNIAFGSLYFIGEIEEKIKMKKL